jgi:hypothetical protein
MFSDPTIPRAVVPMLPTETNMQLVKTIMYVRRGYTGYYYGDGATRAIMYVWHKFSDNTGFQVHDVAA